MTKLEELAKAARIASDAYIEANRDYDAVVALERTKRECLLDAHNKAEDARTALVTWVYGNA